MSNGSVKNFLGRLTSTKKKLNNVLLDDNFYPKICDFGVSYLSENADINLSDIKMNKLKGTPLYQAPEMFDENYLYTYKVDIYAFSLFMYELATCKKPFEHYKYNELVQDVKKGIRPDLSTISNDEIKSFI